MLRLCSGLQALDLKSTKPMNEIYESQRLKFKVKCLEHETKLSKILGEKSSPPKYIESAIFLDNSSWLLHSFKVNPNFQIVWIT